MFIDSHFHSLEMAKKGMNVSELLKEASAAGLIAALDIGILPDDFEERVALTKDFPFVSTTAGIFPGGSEADQTQGLIDCLESQLASNRVAAVGEMGIDFHWNYATPEKQKNLFISQIKLANRYKLPIIVHNRAADTEVLEVFREHPPQYGGIMHCFSSGYSTAASCMDSGLYISFAGNITYKNAQGICEAAKNIPLGRLLIETDAPYLSPHPLRGKKNHPLQILYTYTYIAELRSMEVGDLQKRVTKNYETLIVKKGKN